MKVLQEKIPPEGGLPRNSRKSNKAPGYPRKPWHPAQECSDDPHHKTRKIKVVGRNPMRSIRKAYRAKAPAPKAGAAGPFGQKGAFPSPFFHWEAMRARERGNKKTG